ncbi:MAG: hypothetical protein AAGF73_05025 [Actinomycetota bacterium]
MSSLEALHQVHQRALVDATFRQRLVDEPGAVLREAQVELPDDVEEIIVIEERDGEAVFPIPSQDKLPSALEDAELPDGAAREMHRRLRHEPEFRARLEAHPAEALAEVGVVMPAGVMIRTVSTSSTRPVIVLPPMEPEKRELTDDEFAAVAGGGIVADIESALCACGSQLFTCATRRY